MPGRHAFRRFAGAQQGANHIDAHHLGHDGHVHVFNAPLVRSHNARIVDQAIGGTKDPFCFFKQMDHIGFGPHIALDSDGSAARTLHIGHHLQGCGLRVAVIHHHRKTFGTQQPRSGGTNATAGSGDDHNL